MPNIEANSVTVRGFWKSLPTRSLLKLLTAVFVAFSGFGFLNDILFLASSFASSSIWFIDDLLSFSYQRPWQYFCILVVFSGAVGVGWAFCLIRNLKYVPLVIAFQILFFPALLRILPLEAFSEARAMFDPQTLASRLALDGVGSGAAIVLGYVLFIRFIQTEGLEQLRLRTEIALAQEIHESLVPPISVQTDRLVAYGKSMPSGEVGGDLIDTFENNKGFYIADVSGHGVPAGTVMGMVKSAIRMGLRSADALDSLLNDLNQVLFQLTKPNMFVTFAGIRYDESGQAEFCLAGHLPILHCRNEASRVERLSSKHLPLGLFKDHGFTMEKVQFSPGDVFVLLTDGLTEVSNDEGEEFGIEGIENVVLQNLSKPLDELHESIMEKVKQHGYQFDDQTLLLIRVEGAD